MEKVNVAPQMIFCPQPMYIIGTRNADGQPNFCPITWISFAWHGAPHVVLSIGGGKRTRDNILREGAFAANQVSRDMVWLGDYLGHTSGADGPKDRLPCDYTWGATVPVPVLDASPYVFECRVSRSMALDDGYIFVACVENMQIDRSLEGVDLEQLDLARLDPAIYAPGGYYALGERLGGMGEWAGHLPPRRDPA